MIVRTKIDNKSCQVLGVYCIDSQILFYPQEAESGFFYPAHVNQFDVEDASLGEGFIYVDDRDTLFPGVYHRALLKLSDDEIEGALDYQASPLRKMKEFLEIDS